MGEEFTHVLDSLGWAVLHSIWQGGLAFLFVVVLRFALRGRSPALRHAGQIVTLIACFAAFIYTFAIYLGFSNIGVQGGATPRLANADDAPRLLTGLITPFDSSASTVLSLSRITPVLACLWALGFAAMSLKYAFAFGQVQQLRTLGIQAPNINWTDRFRQLAEQAGISSRVKLYVSANVMGPMTLGLLRPVVLVPIGFLSSLPTDQIEAILRHELAHIRRYDYALNLIQTAVKSVLFFHPAIHIICRWADQDREQACDDLAVSEGHNPLALARGLAALRLQSQPKLGLAATGTGKDMPLLERLTRLAGQSPKRGRPEHMLMSLISLLLLGSVYLGTTTQAEAHPVPPTLPDTVVTAKPVPPVAPVPPSPPVMQPLNPLALKNSDEMRSFMDVEREAYRDFVKEMEAYAVDLERYLKASGLNEDSREYLADEYVDLFEDITEAFEERRENIEDMYEDKIERQAEVFGIQAAAKALELLKARNSKCETCKEESMAEMLGLEAAMKGLEAAERELERSKNSATVKLQREAISIAREEIAKAQADARMARSQAETARSVARAEAVKAATLSKSAHDKAYRSYSTEIDRPSRELHEAFRDHVMRELLKDGLIESADETVFLSHPNYTMSLNGKAMPPTVRGKYCGILDKYGFTDNHSEITIKPDSLTILTDWKDGQHTTRVTYGTFSTQ